jgi:hypothetical protein
MVVGMTVTVFGWGRKGEPLYASEEAVEGTQYCE